jgi:hypothetical protein
MTEPRRSRCNFQEIAMSTARADYFHDLLKDCLEAASRTEFDPEDKAIVVAALIISDSLNGLRKALLTRSGS